MKVLGIELSAKEANVCLVNLEKGLFDLPPCRARKLTVENPHDAGELQYFQRTVAKLVEDYGIDCIAIKERPYKGKFAGSAVSFKLEAALQLLDTQVVLLSSSTIKDKNKGLEAMVDFRETGLKKFQQSAFEVAMAQLQ